MNITKIKNYVESGDITRINDSINLFCERADELMAKKGGIKFTVLPTTKVKNHNKNTELITLLLKNV